MTECPSCHKQYDERVNDAGHCMSCQGITRLAENAKSLDELARHEVMEQGLNKLGQLYVRVRYADGSDTDLEVRVSGQGGPPGWLDRRTDAARAAAPARS